MLASVLPTSWEIDCLQFADLPARLDQSPPRTARVPPRRHRRRCRRCRVPRTTPPRTNTGPRAMPRETGIPLNRISGLGKWCSIFISGEGERFSPPAWIPAARSSESRLEPGRCPGAQAGWNRALDRESPMRFEGLDSVIPLSGDRNEQRRALRRGALSPMILFPLAVSSSFFYPDLRFEGAGEFHEHPGGAEVQPFVVLDGEFFLWRCWTRPPWEVFRMIDRSA